MSTYVLHDREQQRPRVLSDLVDEALLRRLAARAVDDGVGETIEVTAPTSGQQVGVLPASQADAVAGAVAAAREAQRRWQDTPMSRRAEVLLGFHDLVLERREQGMDVIQLETGKARRDAFEEILDTANVARYYARTGARHLRSRSRHGAFPGLTKVVEQRQPLGVVGFIAPWNYPLVLGITDALPAIMAGNGAVIKPDAKTPYSALWAATLLDEAGLQPDLLQLLLGAGSELGAPLIEHVDYLMFTGSTRVGRMLAKQCGERLIGCSMELGGKNAMLV